MSRFVEKLTSTPDGLATYRTGVALFANVAGLLNQDLREAIAMLAVIDRSHLDPVRFDRASMVLWRPSDRREALMAARVAIAEEESVRRN